MDNNPKTLILLVGPPGCGKSYYCKNWLEGYYFRISQDEMGKKEHLEEFKKALDREEPRIVIDRMNFNVAQRARYAAPAFVAGYVVIALVFDYNEEGCYQRICQRENHPTLQADKAKDVIAFFKKEFQPVDLKKEHYIALTQVGNFTDWAGEFNP